MPLVNIVIALIVVGMGLGAFHGLSLFFVHKIVLALLGGHPESAFHVAFVAGLYFLGELFIAGFRGRAVAAALGAGILAFALAAPAILPVLEAIPQTVEGGGRIASVPASSCA